MKRPACIPCGSLVALIALGAMPSVVLAGPPLLCHPIEIGEMACLPWGSGPWDNKPLSKLDDEKFVEQTLALLASSTPVLARMETIRSATIHAAEHPAAAKELLAGLKSRWERTQTSKSPDGMACFDFGYLLATYSQMNIVTEHESRGASGKRTRLSSIDDPAAYGLVSRSLELGDEKGAIEFALALMTSYPKHANHNKHVKNAFAAADDGSLLAKNLVSRFGDNGRQSLEEVRRIYGSRSD